MEKPKIHEKEKNRKKIEKKRSFTQPNIDTVKPVVCATSTSAPPVYPSQFISVPMPSPLQMTCASAPPVYARHAPPFLGPISKSILSKRATMHGSS